MNEYIGEVDLFSVWFTDGQESLFFCFVFLSRVFLFVCSTIPYHTIAVCGLFHCC